MKKLVITLFCLLSLAAFGQAPKVEFDGKNWEAPYTLDFPKDWDVERFLIPIEFAPSIPYKGVEDIRFTPGWGSAKSEEYWSYAFLWYLEGKPAMTAKMIANNLNAYYTGLIGRNIESRKIPAEKVFPVKTSISPAKISPGDAKTFAGTIYMLDYMAQKPITFNCIIHVKYCPGKNNSFIFTEISPKSYADPVWSDLNARWASFNCNAKKK
ncbi:MAG: hypothetical protein ABIQ88_20965 [Chitinophagaceae bacterium]